MFGRIRRRLTLWYSGVLATVLVLFGVALYLGIDRAFSATIDQQLAAMAGEPRFENICLRQHPPFSPMRYAVACYDPTGQITWVSPDASNITNFTSPSFAREAIQTGTARDTIDGGGDVGHVRRLAAALTDAGTGATVGVIEVGASIENDVVALHDFLILLLSVGASTLLLAALGGLFLAQRALEPAHLAMTRQQAFIADASHELRTPLTLLRADAEVLLRGRERLDPDDVALLEDIVAETAHMSTLATTMLSLARLDSGHVQIERDVVDLAAVAAAVVRRATPLAAAAGVTLDVESAGPTLVIGDRLLLEQVALILVDNGIKYNTRGGSVTARVEMIEGQARLEVRDTGVGIASEHLPHLGERFYRVDKARSREAGGAGLGLSIARGLAVAHGGTLTVTSTPGTGTVVTLALPAAHGPTREQTVTA